MNVLGRDAIFDLFGAESYLFKQGLLDTCQRGFCPLDSSGDARVKYTGGNWEQWLHSLPAARADDYALYCISYANTEMYKVEAKRGWQAPPCDGKFLAMPGLKLTRWNPEQTDTVYLREWPEGSKWVVTSEAYPDLDWGSEDDYWILP